MRLRLCGSRDGSSAHARVAAGSGDELDGDIAMLSGFNGDTNDDNNILLAQLLIERALRKNKAA